MNLGDLEFRPEDFVNKDNPVKMFLSEKDIQLADAMAVFSAEQANRILREKLAKAPEVFGFKDNSKDMYYGSWGTLHHPKDTHRARLVCIEEVGSELRVRLSCAEITKAALDMFILWP